MHAWLIAQAYAELVHVDLVRVRGFRAMRGLLRTTHRRVHENEAQQTVRAILAAVHIASVFYLKPIYCLQRSLVLTRLLRRRGVAADLVIGCRPLPFQSHAWVEVAGEAVGDPYDNLDAFHVIDRW
jgi:Transglutaminase-like superfamily